MRIHTGPDHGAGDLHAKAAPGFTIVELVITTAIASIVLIALVVFANMATRSLMGITKQNSLNEDAGHATEVILGRIRLANGVSADSAGNILTMSFDDNINLDSNGDGNSYNDTNHLEQIKFLNGDGQDSTTADNTLVYIPDTSSSTTTILLSGGVRKLPGSNVFSISASKKVFVNFGLLDADKNDYVQAVEIKTSGVRRN